MSLSLQNSSVPAINPSELSVIDGQVTTTSLHVAEHFGKRHDDVIKRIRALDCSPDFTVRNFAECSRKGANNKSEPYFRMTRDGFTFLCMGFTGKRAAQWKEAYINAFNSMSDQLQRVQNDLWYQMLDLERREAFSQSWASFGSRCMLRRKREKPLLQNERNLLEERLQPELSLDPMDARLPH